ncbi:hypothetical protein Tco_1063303 [Tanacetum coccineum]
MLKAIRSSSLCLHQAHRLSTPYRSVVPDKNPKLLQRLFFCSDSSDGGSGSGSGSGSESVSAVVEETENESKSAIVPTAIKKPDDYLTVLALPLPHRPLFPGFYMPIYVKTLFCLPYSVDNSTSECKLG